MKIKWKNLGQIFSIHKYFKDSVWSTSHAQLPTACLICDKTGLVRIFFASRSNDNISRVGYFDYSLIDQKVVSHSNNPVLSQGKIGHFDQFGVYPSSLIKKNDTWYMFYIGWIKGTPQPLFYASIGLAESKDLISFEKCLNVPVMGISEFDPCLVTSPFVFFNEDKYEMAYVSGDCWVDTPQGYSSRYNIKRAFSDDIFKWNRSGQIVIDYANESETNVARPSILKIDGVYHVWFSYVSDNRPYQMGYASGECLTSLTRSKEGLVGFESIDGLSDQMSCYPSVVLFKNKIYMFYNGNQYGKEGVLYAVGEFVNL